jgi:hypothetical protein
MVLPGYYPLSEVEIVPTALLPSSGANQEIRENVYSLSPLNQSRMLLGSLTLLSTWRRRKISIRTEFENAVLQNFWCFIYLNACSDIIVWEIWLVRNRNNVNSSVFWDITPCSQLIVNRRFGGTCSLHLQGRRIGQAIKQREAGIHAGLLLSLSSKIICLLYSVKELYVDITWQYGQIYQMLLDKKYFLPQLVKY